MVGGGSAFGRAFAFALAQSCAGVDVLKSGGCERLVEAVVSRFGTLEVLVNRVGYFGPRGGSWSGDVFDLAAWNGRQSQVRLQASKSGVLALTRAMATDYAPHNIRVNCVCPSATDTPMHREAGGGSRGKEAARSVQGLSSPETIAAAFLYLASDRSPRVTG